MLEHELVPTITRPTRITNSMATLIDNIFISKLLKRSFDSMILLEDISDHLPSLVLMKQTKMRNKEPLNFKSRALNDNKIKCINEELKRKDWNGILRSDNVNVNFDQFCNELNETMDTYAPVKNVHISWKRKYTEPWMNKLIEKATNKCKHLYKKSLSQDATEADKQKYKEYRNTYNKLKRTVQNEYYATKCREYGKNTKQLWRMISGIICKRKQSGSIISYITINGVKMYDANKIANEFSRYYAKMGADLARKIPDSKKKVQEYVHDIPRTLNSLVVGRVEYTDVEKIISALPAKTSSGHDGISNQFLKELNSSISYPLSIIFNQSLSSGVFSENMKLAKIVPLFKGKEDDMVVNYRPVSLLMTISKVLEKIMYNKMYGFLSHNNIFFDSQYGFRSKRSCEHAIMEMVGRVLQTKNKGKHSMGVFLDLSKAFDTLDHPVLIAKLERYGIRGNMLDWFKSYLSGRSLVAKISNSTNVTTYSEKYDITFGIAQGSCLGPLLFVIFCNDIYMLPIIGKLILFADDTTLIETHRNKKFLDYAICHDMLLLMDWFMANKLMLNLNKTVAMNFWPGNKKGVDSINIMDVNIPFMQITRFLGVYLDENMDWKSFQPNLQQDTV